MKKAETEKEKELLGALEEMVNQACSVPGTDELDSMAVTAYANAMHLLEEYGRIKVGKEYGRRVIGKWIKGK